MMPEDHQPQKHTEKKVPSTWWAEHSCKEGTLRRLQCKTDSIKNEDCMTSNVGGQLPEPI
jgi:hypothetical protein